MRLKNKIVVTGAALLVGFNLAWAEQTHTLQECFQAALKRSEVLADQEEQIIQAEEHYRQVQAALMPSVAAQAAYQVEGGSGENTNQHYAKLSLSQPLFRGFREFAAINQAWNLITAQHAAKDWAGVQLYRDVSDAYFNVLTWQKEVEHVDAQIQLYQRRIQDLQNRVAIGRSRPTEVLSVQSAQASLKAQRQQLAGQEAVARDFLTFLTGMDSGIILQPLADAMPPIEPVDTYLALLETRPDILAARQHVEAMQKNIGLAEGEHWPTLDANGNYYLERSAPNADTRWDAQVVLTLPLFMGGEVVAKTRAAESQVRQSVLALNRLRRLAAEEVRSQYHRLQSNQEQLKLLEEALQLAQRNYQGVLRDYNLSLVNNLDVLQAMSAYQDTLRAVDRMRFDVQNTFEQLEATAAKRLHSAAGEEHP